MNARLLQEPTRSADRRVREFEPGHRQRADSAVRAPLATAALILIFALRGVANAQYSLPDALATLKTNSARSASGQFVVAKTGGLGRPGSAPEPANDRKLLQLEPALTAVACERIKRALADELNDRSPWRGKIYVTLHRAQSAGDRATIVIDKFRDGWNYRLNLPETMERGRFVRAVVETVLLERANRSAADHSAEIPLWLSEGLTKHLRAKMDIELVPEPMQWSSDGRAMGPTVYEISRVNPRKSGNRTSRETKVGNTVVIDRTDPLEEARRQLRERPPLTLQELSWPDDVLLGSADGEVYRNSAHLFVAELLHLEDGRACLRGMLNGLGQCYNWQTAFFRAFHSHFEQQVDLEKWWVLTVAHFSSRQLNQTWSPEQSWNKLDQALRTPVEVRHTRQELPDRGALSLANVIRDWDFISQDRTLRAKLHELELLRLRMSQDLVELVDDYRSWLARYLEKRSQAGMLLPGSKVTAPGAKLVVRDALMQFDELESRREALRPRAEKFPEPAGANPALPPE